MKRAFSIIAFLIAIGVTGTAIWKLNDRSTDDAALETPTALPSPTIETTQAPSPSRMPSPSTSLAAAGTSEPSAEPTDEPEPTPTVAPRTPTPEPEITAGPVDASGDEHPPTGANSWPVGLAIALAALVLRGRLLSREGP